MALFLDKSDQRVYTSLEEIWSLAQRYWIKNDRKVVKDLFNDLLFQKHEKVSKQFEKIKKTPLDLCQNLFGKQQDP